jgi:hypothetical protein
MADPLTAGVLVGLAIQKFVEAGAGELAKKFTTEAIAKIPELWQQIKNKLQGRSPKVDEALVKLESGDLSAIDTVNKNLDVVLDDEPEFANELKLLAQTIQAGKLQDNRMNVQNNYDNARGYINNIDGGTNYIGEIHIQQGKSPNS